MLATPTSELWLAYYEGSRFYPDVLKAQIRRACPRLPSLGPRAHWFRRGAIIVEVQARGSVFRGKRFETCPNTKYYSAAPTITSPARCDGFASLDKIACHVNAAIPGSGPEFNGQGEGTIVKLRLLFVGILAALVGCPLAAEAQGVPDGAAHGAYVGDQTAGPIGGVVGGVVGGFIGGVNGMLGIHPASYSAVEAPHVYRHRHYLRRHGYSRVRYPHRAS